MKKRLVVALPALALLLGLSACTTNTAPKPEKTPETTPAAVETFSAEYEMKGTTSSGAPKNDTFIFEGKTEGGIITELNFDIIRNKGTDKAYSKKDIMGYLMNISDAKVEQDGDSFKLTKLTCYGYDTKYAEGSAAQFMVSASAETLTDKTTFKELVFSNDAAPGQSVELDKAIIAYQYLATEAGITALTGDTLVKDMLSAHGLYANNTFAAGEKRVSFAGFNGGRSYGEQMTAISDYILANKMTLDDVYTMFKTENQAATSIEDRDAISGATITFVGDFQRMVYVAIHGEIFEGVTEHAAKDGNATVQVVTQGYGGEIETHVTFDGTGKITAITVRDNQETENIGGALTVADSDFIQALIAGQDKVDGVDNVSGATVTSASMKKAVQYAIDYYKGL